MSRSGKSAEDPFAKHFGDAPPDVPKSTKPDDTTSYDHAFADKPPEEVATPPGHEVTKSDAAVKGIGNALTFGLSPAIAGLAEASGMPSASEGHPEGEGLDINPVRPIVGAAKMFHEWLSDHPDPSVKAAYERGRQAQLNDEQLSQEQHPAAYIAGQLGGALALPLGAAGGVTAAAKIGRSVAAGGVGGGLYGAGDAVGHGEDAATVAKDAVKGAATGAAFGGVAGAGGHVISKGVDKGLSVIRGTRDVDAEAGRRVVDAIRSDMESQGPQLSSHEIAAANAAGTPRAIVDTGGERTRALARSAANTSPEARQALAEVTQNRFEDQAPRLGSFIRRITGGANADADTQTLQAAAKIANKPAYAKAYAQGSGGVWHEGLAQLLKSPDFAQAAQEATRTGANKAAAQGFTPVKNPFVFGADGSVSLAGNAQPNLQFWDAVKQNLDDKIGAAVRAGEKGHAADLLALKSQLTAHLDAAVPAYKAARSGAAAFFGAEDALEAGQKFVMSNSNINEARRAISKMSGPERDLFARGFASDLADKIERTGDNRNVLNSIFLNNGPARQKINIALGAKRADQLEALLRAEHVVDQARKAVSGNSTTARQLAESGLAGGGAVATFEGLKEHEFNPVHVLTAALTFGALRHGAKVIDSRVARRVGEMLASNDPTVLAKGAQIVAQSPTYLDALRRATAAGVRIGTQDIGFDNATAGAAIMGQRVLSGPESAGDHAPDNGYDLPQQ